ncbi:MAG: hypothetical protein EOO62_17805 [Hymenobacter sp.]|nr:MAG: hypothetical protein EOO62_17805 [Hymenobacter sp.]
MSISIGMSGKFNVKSPFKPSFKLDLIKVLDFKKLGLSISESKTEYGLIYGNGSDYIPQRGNRDITGWHWPVNQNDY